MSSRLLLLPLLALCTTLAACATPTTVPAMKPAPTTPAGDPLRTSLTSEGAWRLTEARDAGGKRLDALFGEGVDIRLQFVDDRVSVLGVCNRMGGRYGTSTGQLRIDTLASTRMACAGPKMEAETAIGRLLQQPLRARFLETSPVQLELRTAAGEWLLLRALPLE